MLNKKEVNKSFRVSLGEKGLSPVIATILLITLAFALVAIIFIWMTGFVTEQLEKQGKPVEQVCKEVAFETEQDIIGKTVYLQVVNRGNVNIYGIDIEFVEEKDSSMKSITFDVPIGESSAVQPIQVVGPVTKLILHPMILGSVKGKKVNKPVTCLDVEKTINLG